MDMHEAGGSGGSAAMPLDLIITERAALKLNHDYLRREAELKAVKDLIVKDPAIRLQICGIGGIGKTTFCCHLFWDYYQELAAEKTPAGIRYLGWIKYKENLKSSVFRQLDDTGITTDNPDEYWKQTKRLFNRLSHRLLLFIDNADGMTKEDMDYLLTCKYRVVMSSRDTDNGFEKYPLKSSPEFCMEIYRNFNSDVPADDPAANEILKMSGYHTQTVMRLAKTQKESGYSAGRMLKAIQDSRFSLEEIAEQIASGRLDERSEDSFEDSMRKLVDLAKLNRQQQDVLMQFSLLAPNEPLSADYAESWFDAGALQELIGRGLLNTDENDDLLMHPVIAEAVQNKYKPDSVFAAPLIEKLTDALTATMGKGVAVQNALLPHCVSVDNALQGTETNGYARFLDRIARILKETGDYDRALSYAQRAVVVAEKVNGTEDLDTAAIYNNIGLVYRAMGDYDKALEYALKDLAITEKVLGTEHPSTATTYNNIASVYYRVGDYDKALEFYNKALKIYEKVLGTTHPETAMSYEGCGLVYEAMDDNDKALEYYNKALKIYEKVLGTAHPETARFYNNIACAYHSKGDYDKAFEFYNKALKIYEKVLGPEHPETVQTYRNLALLYEKMGDKEKAAEYRRKAKS